MRCYLHCSSRSFAHSGTQRGRILCADHHLKYIMITIVLSKIIHTYNSMLHTYIHTYTHTCMMIDFLKHVVPYRSQESNSFAREHRSSEGPTPHLTLKRPCEKISFLKNYQPGEDLEGILLTYRNLTAPALLLFRSEVALLGVQILDAKISLYIVHEYIYVCICMHMYVCMTLLHVLYVYIIYMRYTNL